MKAGRPGTYAMSRRCSISLQAWAMDGVGLVAFPVFNMFI